VNRRTAATNGFAVGARNVRPPLPPLPDYLAPGLAIVFVGINPGERSARIGHYYGNPRNPFWRLLHEAGLTPRRLRPEEDALLPRFGLGITDLVKRPSRGAGDLAAAEFRRGRPALEAKLLRARPRIVCFNGKTGFLWVFGRRAFRRFGRQPVALGASRVFVVPSTSPANAAVPLAAKRRGFVALRRWRDALARGGPGACPSPRPPRAPAAGRGGGRDLADGPGSAA
jgi:TDG/mug DNA glycosylase family protein